MRRVIGMNQQVLPRGTRETNAFCPACRQHATFRAAPGHSWFCTLCGAAGNPQPVAVVYEGEQSRTPYILLLLLVICGAVWGLGQATASGQVLARCGALTDCTLTFSNNSFWPMRVDNIAVGGRPAQGFGSAVAGPFGTATISLYDGQGKPITTATTTTYTLSAVLGPASWNQTLDLQSQN